MCVRLPSMPTVSSMNNSLSRIANWERYAIYLPDIEYSHIEEIKKEHQSIVNQKLALFDKWLSVHLTPSWTEVAEALQKSGDKVIAGEIMRKPFFKARKSIDQTFMPDATVMGKLQSLHKTFTEIAIDIRKIVEGHFTSLQSTLVTVFEEQQILEIDTESLGKASTCDKFFKAIRPSYNFLNCHILTTIAETVGNKDILHRMSLYSQELEKFMNDTPVNDLREVLRDFQLKKRHGEYSNVTLVIKLSSYYQFVPMKLLNRLLENFLGVIPDWLEVTNGSVVVSFFIPSRISSIVIKLVEEKERILKLMGVFRVEIDLVTIFDGYEEQFDMKSSLLLTAKLGHYEAVKILLQLGADLKACDENGKTAVTIAKEHNHFKIAKLIQDAEVAGASHPSMCHSMLPFAVSGAQKALKNHHFSNSTSENSFKAIRLVESCRLGLMNEVDQELKQSPKLVLDYFVNEMSPLMAACENGYPETVKLLLENKGDPNLRPANSGKSPLMIASKRGFTETAKLLLDAKANPNLRNQNGQTALMIAVENNHFDVAELLLEYKSNPDTFMDNRTTAMMLASRIYSDSKWLKLLMFYNANPNINDSDGWTALMIASLCGHSETVKVLVGIPGIEVNRMNENGVTALILAAKEGHLEVVKILLTSMAFIDVKDTNGETALMKASSNGHAEVCKVLLENNANPLIRSASGKTALSNACYHDHADIVSLLLTHGVDPNCPIVEVEEGNWRFYIIQDPGKSPRIFWTKNYHY